MHHFLKISLHETIDQTFKLRKNTRNKIHHDVKFSAGALVVTFLDDL